MVMIMVQSRKISPKLNTSNNMGTPKWSTKKFPKASSGPTVEWKKKQGSFYDTTTRPKLHALLIIFASEIPSKSPSPFLIPPNMGFVMTHDSWPLKKKNNNPSRKFVATEKFGWVHFPPSMGPGNPSNPVSKMRGASPFRWGRYAFCGWFRVVLEDTPACFRGCYLEDHPKTDGYVFKLFNNYGDRFRPLRRVVGSLANGLFMVYKWGC